MMIAYIRIQLVSILCCISTATATILAGKSHEIQSISTSSADTKRKEVSHLRKLPKKKKCNKVMSTLHELEDDDHFAECKEYLSIPSTTPTMSHYPSLVPSIEPTLSHFPSQKPTQQPSSIPSQSRSPSDSPTLEPSKLPSTIPTLHPTSFPSSYPTKVPTKSPSSSPSVSSVPSLDPSQSSLPSLTKTFEQFMPDFFLEFHFKSHLRRLSTKQERTLAINIHMKEEIIREKLSESISASYAENLPFFDRLSLAIQFDRKYASSTGTTLRYIFGGTIFFVTNRIEDIPNDSQLRTYTEGAIDYNSMRGVTVPEYSSLSLNIVSDDFWKNSSHVDLGSLRGETQVVENSGSLLLTIGVCAVATLTTIGAVTLIFTQKEKMFKEKNNYQPPSTSISPKSFNQIVSPWSDSPLETNVSRKFFMRLDDNSTQPGRYESNFNHEEESSLEAPSMVGISSVNERSVFGESSIDVESLTNMSALDEVRLGSVLQIEETSVLGIGDNNTQGKKAFSQLWDGKHSKRRTIGCHPTGVKYPLKAAATEKPNDMNHFHNNYNELGKEGMIDTDGISLLCDQSIKKEYYGDSMTPRREEKNTGDYEESELSLDSKTISIVGSHNSSTSIITSQNIDETDISLVSADLFSTSSPGFHR